MNGEPGAIRSRTVTRIASTARRRVGRRAPALAGRREFGPGQMVRSRARVRNDGTYPRRDIGEVLVRENDLGCVCESWSFLGECFYTVEFVDRAIVVIMRACEITNADIEAGEEPTATEISDDRSILLVG